MPSIRWSARVTIIHFRSTGTLRAIRKARGTAIGRGGGPARRRELAPGSSGASYRANTDGRLTATARVRRRAQHSWRRSDPSSQPDTQRRHAGRRLDSTTSSRVRDVNLSERRTQLLFIWRPLRWLTDSREAPRRWLRPWPDTRSHSGACSREVDVVGTSRSFDTLGQH